MRTLKTLKRFTNPKSERLDEPWFFNGWYMASNDCIVIAAKDIDLEGGTVQGPKHKYDIARTRIFEPLPVEGGIKMDVKDLDHYQKYRCRCCDPVKGKAPCPCRECGGEGHVSFKTNFHEYAQSCRTCGGIGDYVPGGIILTSLCHECDATGWDREALWRFPWGVYVALSYLGLILDSFKNVIFYPTVSVAEPIRFAFEGGLGVLAAMRDDPDSEQDKMRAVNE
jgi:hypothetical protein